MHTARQHVVRHIEFIGGPLDGYYEAMALPLEPFVGVLSDTGSPSMTPWKRLLRVLFGYRQPGGVRLAVYEIAESRRPVPCYRYVRTHAIDRAKLQNVDGLSRFAEQLSRTRS